jgi:hypothetical protein
MSCSVKKAFSRAIFRMKTIDEVKSVQQALKAVQLAKARKVSESDASVQVLLHVLSDFAADRSDQAGAEWHWVVQPGRAFVHQLLLALFQAGLYQCVLDRFTTQANYGQLVHRQLIIDGLLATLAPDVAVSDPPIRREGRDERFLSDTITDWLLHEPRNLQLLQIALYLYH